MYSQSGGVDSIYVKQAAEKRQDYAGSRKRI